jgi:hypothetical protein
VVALLSPLKHSAPRGSCADPPALFLELASLNTSTYHHMLHSAPLPAWPRPWSLNRTGPHRPPVHRAYRLVSRLRHELRRARVCCGFAPGGIDASDRKESDWRNRTGTWRCQKVSFWWWKGNESSIALSLICAHICPLIASRAAYAVGRIVQSRKICLRKDGERLQVCFAAAPATQASGHAANSLKWWVTPVSYGRMKCSRRGPHKEMRDRGHYVIAARQSRYRRTEL